MSYRERMANIDAAARTHGSGMNAAEAGGTNRRNLDPVSFRARSLGDGDDKLRWKAIAPDCRRAVGYYAWVCLPRRSGKPVAGP